MNLSSAGRIAAAVIAALATACAHEDEFKFQPLLNHWMTEKVGADLKTLKVEAVECGAPGLVQNTLRITCPIGIAVRANTFKDDLYWDFAIKDERALSPNAVIEQTAAEVSAVIAPLLQEQERQKQNQEAWTRVRAQEEELARLTRESHTADAASTKQ